MNRFPRLRILAVLVTALMILPALPSQAVADDEDITFDGSGWGHGIGMSQYGAYGMALNGYSAPEILSHYYQQTSTVDMSDTSAPSFFQNSQPLWIGLMQNRTSARFELSGGGGTFVQGGKKVDVQPTDGETWRFHVNSQGKCFFQRLSPAEPAKAGSPGDCNATFSSAAGTTVTMLDEGYKYSSGRFRFRAVPNNPSTFHVVLQLGLDPYLGGIAEMPTSWHMEALKAQVIAARSYLVYNVAFKGPQKDFSTTIKNNCWCHLYDDTRSQVYKGDILLNNTRWQNAVSSTSGQVVAYNGSVISAFYSSSSGGKTENIEDLWPVSARPYLVSVDDHWAHISDVKNPRSNWSFTRTAGTIASAVGLDELKGISVSHRPSGAVSSITFEGVASGTSKAVTRTGDWARRNFGLYSQYFNVSGIEEKSEPKTTNAYQITENSSTPIGWVDGVKDNGDGTFGVRGWTLDFDTELPILIHIYVDGKFAKGVWADNKRADVARVHNNGDRHGFNTSVKASDGSHTVCVYAINAPTKSGNPRIGCKTVKVTSPGSGGSSQSTSPSASKPFGWIDGISISGGTLDTRGWAIDKDASDKPVPIHIYVDGQFFQGGPADEHRPDVHRAHNLGKKHGFEFSKSISSGSHRVCVYAINLPEKSGNPLLGCKTVSG